MSATYHLIFEGEDYENIVRKQKIVIVCYWDNNSSDLCGMYIYAKACHAE